MANHTGLSIQSKIILVLLALSLLTVGIIGWIGYESGRNALTQCLYAELEGQRITRANAVRSMLNTIRGQVITLSANQESIDALEAFKSAMAEMRKKTPLTPEIDSKIRDYYEKEYLPALVKNSDSQPVLSALLPNDPLSRYLQYQYIAKTTDVPYEKKFTIDSSKDGSPYDDVHKKFHHNFRQFTELFGFEDLHLIDAETGEIVYTTQKSMEFATNLLTGPYADTSLGDLFKAIRRAQNRDDYRIVDFERYKPSLNQPASFIASPIISENRMIGVLVLQFPVDRLVEILTGKFQWEKEGLGKTGEVYLVGRDRLFRSRSRIMVQDRPKALASFRAAGIPAAVVDRCERQGNALLALPADTEGVRQALAGHEGTGLYADYRNEPVVGSYGPLDFEDIRWAIVAEMDESEAFSPIHLFGRRLLTAATGLGLGASLLGLLLSSIFVRPLKELMSAARKVARGEVGAVSEVSTGDEFGELSETFNEMSRTLKTRTDELEQKVRENEELLLNILPASAAARFREGDAQTAQTFNDVTVLYADVTGLDAVSEQSGSQKSLNLLNDLVVAFDDAAERLGVEKVKTVGASYLAVCGLSVQRPDHTARIIEFAQEMGRIVERFNREKQTDLTLQVGINAGPVTGGVIGRNKFIYDLWGETVTVAKQLRRGDQTSVHVTQAVLDRVRDQFPVGERSTVSSSGRTIDSFDLKLF